MYCNVKWTKLKRYRKNSCRAKARAWLRRILAAVTTVLIFCFSGMNLSARNKSCRSVAVAEEERAMSERSPRKRES